jgi:hypothetical protein
MGEYVKSVAEGDNLNGKSNLSDDTICQYLRGAASWLRHHCQVDVPLYTNEGETRKAEKLHPYISELLAQRHTHSEVPFQSLFGQCLPVRKSSHR